MKSHTRRTLMASLMSLCFAALGACGGDGASSDTTAGACGRASNGQSQCSVVIGGTCPAGQYCNQPMLSCSPGCTSDDNCSSGEACIRPSGQAVGACQRCATTTCGNGRCETGETAASCAADCAVAAAPVCGNGRCEAGESTASCAGDCPGTSNPACPSVSGSYTVSALPGLPPACAPPNAVITVTQSGCAVTVANLFPTPVTFPIDPVGVGAASYNMGGVTGSVTFVFAPDGTLRGMDTGVAAGCAITGVRNP